MNSSRLKLQVDCKTANLSFHLRSLCLVLYVRSLSLFIYHSTLALCSLKLSSLDLTFLPYREHTHGPLEMPLQILSTLSRPLCGTKSFLRCSCCFDDACHLHLHHQCQVIFATWMLLRWYHCIFHERADSKVAVFVKLRGDTLVW